VADDSKSIGSPTDALRWLAKAEDDLAVANIVADAPAGVNWAACFHAQKATEKALKAVLVAYGIDFPRSHALERLIALMPAEPASTFDFEAVAELTPSAIAGRYPEDNPSPDLPTTRRLIHAAKTMLQRPRPSLPASIRTRPPQNDRLGVQLLDERAARPHARPAIARRRKRASEDPRRPTGPHANMRPVVNPSFLNAHVDKSGPGRPASARAGFASVRNLLQRS
jgi:HEPN domain-containing protein